MAEEGAELDQIIAGKYRLTRMVGRGGMGSVWEGLHTSLGTRVAVKFIDAEHAQSKEAQSRFINEARAAAKLRSKFVVQVYDQGVTEDGRPYIVMEFLAGEPLDRRLDCQRQLSL
jgi:serine/threonine-protein kinase